VTHTIENGVPAPVTVWHDEADRLAAWGTLDPPDACMCCDCVLPPADPIEKITEATT
jgi:hypothetical protein